MPLLCFPLLACISTQRLPDFLDARRFWAKAIKESPKSSDVWHNFASVLTDDTRYMESEKYYREALRLDPSRHLSHLNLAYIYNKQYRRAEAIEELYRELENAPFSIKACESLSILYLEVGDARLSQEWKEKAAKMKAGIYVQPFKQHR
jgi:tetratricopeptide (TPR) repeat protein